MAFSLAGDDAPQLDSVECSPLGGDKVPVRVRGHWRGTPSWARALTASLRGA